LARRGKDGQTGGEAFWRFSLALYARPGVAAALLALQDRGGGDVNLMLFALWRGAVHGCRLRPDDMAAAAAAIVPVGAAVVEKLRMLRRRLKASGEPSLEALRRRIAGLELVGEQCAQYRLAGGIAAAPHPASARERLAAAIANLALYLDGEAGSAEAATITAAVAALMRSSREGT
jgi:uncharacterized protein (TIGR02444 family)